MTGLEALLLLGVVLYFSLGVAGLAKFMDWGTEPGRSFLWVAPFMFLLIFLIFSSIWLVGVVTR